MKELGRGTAYNTHNTTSLIRTPQACIRHLADGRSLHGGRVYTHAHGTIIRTGIILRKSLAICTTQLAGVLLLEMLKYFEVMLNIFEFSRV